MGGHRVKSTKLSLSTSQCIQYRLKAKSSGVKYSKKVETAIQICLIMAQAVEAETSPLSYHVARSIRTTPRNRNFVYAIGTVIVYPTSWKLVSDEGMEQMQPVPHSLEEDRNLLHVFFENDHRNNFVTIQFANPLVRQTCQQQLTSLMGRHLQLTLPPQNVRQIIGDAFGAVQAVLARPPPRL